MTPRRLAAAGRSLRFSESESARSALSTAAPAMWRGQVTVEVAPVYDRPLMHGLYEAGICGARKARRQRPACCGAGEWSSRARRRLSRGRVPTRSYRLGFCELQTSCRLTAIDPRGHRAIDLFRRVPAADDPALGELAHGCGSKVGAIVNFSRLYDS
jgi:hypothetical protein